MPNTVELTRRDGVELVRTGSWQISTGRWVASREDLAHAVAALRCPAVRKPVIWIGHQDQRFTPRPDVNANSGDGEPGVGWIENLRLVDGGHTLVGDYVGMPAWLDQVLASAYPDRSIEAAYNRRCQLGHTHPFVLDGVALLGVTRPGVGTLRSLQSLDDVKALYGLAASDGVAAGEVRIIARFDPGQARDADGKWTDTPGSTGTVLPDKLKIAGRIRLKRGETLAGSTSVTAEGGTVAPMAAVDGPDGRRLRLGVGILAEDRRSWAAANRGGTVLLDADGVAKLADAGTRMHAAATEGRTRHRQLADRVRELGQREADIVGSQYRTKAQAREVLALRRQIEADERVRELLLRPSRGDVDPDLATRLRRNRLNDAARLERRVVENRARLAELDSEATPLSDSQRAELAAVRRDLGRAETDLERFGDTTVLAEGVIPSPWGDLVWRTHTQESSVRHQMQVRPADPPDDWAFGDDDRDSAFTDGQLQKLVREAEALMSGRVKAAAEQHSGAMVALIPAVADAERLAVEGGEPADQLHVTLAYLGDAVDLDTAARQDLIDAVSSAVNGAPIVRADAFALSAFNPPGGPAAADGRDRDACLVLGVGGDDLDGIHTLVRDALGRSGVPMATQHAPWVPHLTLIYTDDLSRLAGLVDRVGPVVFDRIRIALAGQIIDIPLIAEESADETGTDIGEVHAAVADDNQLKRYWTKDPRGLAQWVNSAHPWTALFNELKKHVGPARAKRIASAWFKEVFGIWPGERKGANPTGPG